GLDRNQGDPRPGLAHPRHRARPRPAVLAGSGMVGSGDIIAHRGLRFPDPDGAFRGQIAHFAPRGLDPGQGGPAGSPDTPVHADHLPPQAGTDLALRRGTAAALRPARTTIHLLPDRAAFRRGLWRGRLPRPGPAQQPGPDPTPAVAVRPHPVLPEPVLLLWLQPYHHPRRGPGPDLPRSPGARDRARRAVVRPRPRS